MATPVKVYDIPQHSILLSDPPIVLQLAQPLAILMICLPKSRLSTRNMANSILYSVSVTSLVLLKVRVMVIFLMIQWSYWLETWRVGPLLFLHVRVQLITREAPIECYIMQGEHPLPESVVEKFAKTGGELCKNVFLMSEHHNTECLAGLWCWLGKSGIITTAHGLRIACLGGTYDSDIYASAEAPPVRPTVGGTECL